MLENNGLLDEQKITYLIDLDKKNPDAIGKLIKESGIDPLDVNTQEEPKYTPGNYSVSDAQVNLDAVLDRPRWVTPRSIWMQVTIRCIPLVTACLTAHSNTTT